MPEAGAMPVTQYMPQRGLVDSGPSASNALSRPQAANQAVRRGVITGFIKVCERWQIGTAKQIALLGYADDEFAGGQILSGRARGAQDVKDRVGYMVAIAVGLRALFNNNTSSERRWLEMPRPEIGNKSPLDYMAEGRMVGMMQVRELVDRERAL
ncbi:MbcA/ParS/Xre antitoxin family protein [Bradyrhizobium jicamae]|uniref:MbcA/ParS/Xre antitoxin family protein n=1 Tax=Bradyrhizobium jicamae TaxID=280332 RepID=UPI001BA96F7E|nr:MbcA/ParS/Xre antitoxin family protein [Bradyrhizobium jicamae]